MKAATAATVLLMVTVPLVGCIGNETDPVEQQSIPDTNETADPLSNEPVLYTRSNGTVERLDPEEALGGLPAPTGTARVVEAPLFEPTIRHTSDGTLFVSNTGKGEPSEESPPPDTEYSSILRSTDHGETWEDVTQNVGPVSIPPNTGDPYVYVDEDTDRVYNLDMIGLNCNWVRWSDDKGGSWTSNPLGCGQPAFQDHPTLFSGEPTTLETTLYENVLYICVNRLADSACAVSLDGGISWSAWRTVFPDPQNNGDTCGGLHAHGTTGPDGTAYLPIGCDTPRVGISEDNGLTWERVTISENVTVDGHEVAFAVDNQGNAFAFWISDELNPTLAVSTDGGHTWDDPINVAPPNVSTTSHPTIAAGENGSIAMAYIGTETDADYQDMPDNATWNGYITTIVNATSEDPTIATTTANDPEHPIGKGVCGGTRCRAPNDGGVGDFIDITITDEGRPWAAFVDVCHEECEQPGGPTEPTNGTGLVGTLNTGPSLTGDLEALTPLDQLSSTNGGSSQGSADVPVEGSSLPSP